MVQYISYDFYVKLGMYVNMNVLHVQEYALYLLNLYVYTSVWYS